MIRLPELSEAARYSDAGAEEHGIENWCSLNNIDLQSLHYVAEQRALRAAMLLDGQDPKKLSRTEKTPVELSEEAKKLMPTLTMLAMDGIGIGIMAGRQDS